MKTENIVKAAGSSAGTLLATTGGFSIAHMIMGKMAKTPTIGSTLLTAMVGYAGALIINSFANPQGGRATGFASYAADACNGIGTYGLLGTVNVVSDKMPKVGLNGNLGFTDKARKAMRFAFPQVIPSKALMPAPTEQQTGLGAMEPLELPNYSLISGLMDEQPMANISLSV